MSKKATKQEQEKDISTGICAFCKAEVAKPKMTQHLKFCKQRATDIAAEITKMRSSESEQTKLFHIIVEGTYLPMYWMHLEMPIDAMLADLDDFLRATWLECCDHLSAFTIGKGSYTSQPPDLYWDFQDPHTPVVEQIDDDEFEEEEEEAGFVNVSPVEMLERLQELVSKEFPPNFAELPPAEVEAKLTGLLTAQLPPGFGGTFPPEMQAGIGTLSRLLQTGLLDTLLSNGEQRERHMDVELGKVLKEGQKFQHEYDFGSTTTLSLRVVAEREGVVAEDEAGDALAVRVIARNELPAIACDKCGEAADYILGGGSTLCQKCLQARNEENKKRYTRHQAEDEIEAEEADGENSENGEMHEEEEYENEEDYEDYYDYGGEGLLLPIVNSPRMGVCGYTGRD